MLYSRTHVINEKTKAIKIPQPANIPTQSLEYGLKNAFFDPFESSPPNEFMLKLRMRMKLHESLTKQGLSQGQSLSLGQTLGACIITK